MTGKEGVKVLPKKSWPNEKLIAAAQKVFSNSYSPYSKFAVGCALLGEDRAVYSGTNVESGSYGLTICAERAAVFAAVSAGCRKFVAAVVVSNSEGFPQPCGACLQVLSEFALKLPIILVNREGLVKETSLEKLLPAPFRPGS